MDLSLYSILYRFLTKKVSIRLRIYLAAGFMALLIGSYLFYTVHSQQQLRTITHEILDARIQAMHAAQNLKHIFVIYDDMLFRYLALNDIDPMKEHERLRKNAEIEIQRLRLLSNSRVVQSQLVLLQDESKKYFSEAGLLLAYSKQTLLPEGAGIFKTYTWAKEHDVKQKDLALLSAEGRTRLQRVFEMCDELVTLNRVDLERAQAEMNDLLTTGRQTAIGVGVVVGGIMLLIAIGLAVSLLGPLRELLEGVERIDAGDLNFEIPVTSADEVGRLTTAFNRMTRTVREQRAQLLQETITDALTGAFNQRHFRTLLKQELERARRTKQPLSILMMDIDHFKRYNDAQGHENGNEVLKGVCNTIREILREVDSLVRYGGDELCAILPDTWPKDAKMVAERVIEAVANSHFPGQETLPAGHITLSIGIAGFPENANSVTDIILKADEALYAAKEEGRARVHAILV